MKLDYTAIWLGILMGALAGSALGQATPTPVPTPTPCPVCPDCENFTFTYSAEQWLSHSLSAFTAPDMVYNPNVPGTLEITATDNVSNFGYWESPPFNITEAPLPASSETRGVDVPDLLGKSVFVAEFIMVGDAEDQIDVPEIRLRTTSVDSQQADLAVISSNNAGGISPYLGNPSMASLFFRPTAGGADFRMQFDMLNFSPQGDSPSAMVGIDEVSVCQFTAIDISQARSEASFKFDDDDGGWSTTVFEDFVEPLFHWDEAGGGLTITAVPPGDRFEFGYWGSPETEPLVRPEEGRLYFAEFTVATDQIDAADVPGFRLRINDSQFRVAQYVRVASTGDASNTPTLGNPKTYTVFLPPNVAIANAFLTYSFDMVTQAVDNDSTSASISLTGLRVWSVPLP